MATIAQRLAKLEQHETGERGAGVLGIRTIYDDTGTGPDVVTVQATGETLTEAEFCRRYPQGLLIHLTHYGTPGDAA